MLRCCQQGHNDWETFIISHWQGPTWSEMNAPKTTATLQSENNFLGANNITSLVHIVPYFHQNNVEHSIPFYIVLLKKTDGTHLKKLVNWVTHHDVSNLYHLQLHHVQWSHPNLLGKPKKISAKLISLFFPYTNQWCFIITKNITNHH